VYCDLRRIPGQLCDLYPPLVCVPLIGNAYRIIEYSRAERVLGARAAADRPAGGRGAAGAAQRHGDERYA
jgi:hypothetical protein